MTEKYCFSLKTSRPSLRFAQIEAAKKAVAEGSPCVAISFKDGVVFASERLASSKEDIPMIDPDIPTTSKAQTPLTKMANAVESINTKIGVVYSGKEEDYRKLVEELKYVQSEKLHDNLPLPEVVQGVASVMEEYIHSKDKDPYNVSLLVGGWQERPYIFQCDPSGAYYGWKATTLGNKEAEGKEFLETKFKEKLEEGRAIDLALKTLEVMTQHEVEVGIADQNGFRLLASNEIQSLRDESEEME